MSIWRRWLSSSAVRLLSFPITAKPLVRSTALTMQWRDPVPITVSASLLRQEPHHDQPVLRRHTPIAPGPRAAATRALVGLARSVPTVVPGAVASDLSAHRAR